MEHVPEQYEVVSYWQSVNNPRLVFTNQLFDLRAFYKYQKRIREYYGKRGTFPEFVDKVRNRRRRHGLEGDVGLLPDLTQQTRLDNWIEFQEYHLQHYEREEMDVKNQKEERDAAQTKKDISGPGDADDVDIPGLHTGKMDLLGFHTGKVKYFESKVEEHGKMLRWIEQERKVLVAEQAASVHITGDQNRPRSMSTLDSPTPQKRKRKPRLPLGPGRLTVSKKSPPKQKRLQPPKRNAPQSAEDATTASKAPRRSKRIADLRDKSFRDDVECTRFAPPQSAARANVTHARKSRKSVNVDINANARWQPTGRSKRRKLPQQSPSRVMKTRSGREIKRPKILGFDPARKPHI